MRQCPLCSRNTAGVKRHLTNRHGVENHMELGLLIALMTGWFKGHLDCVVCDKKRLSWLDRHLANMHGISGSELTKLIAMAKEEYIIRKLADLEARGPEPSMVSELDLDDATYAKPRSITLEDEEPVSQSPSPPSDTQYTEPPLSAPEEQATASTSADPGPLPKGRTPEVPRRFNRTMVGQALQDYQEFHTVSEPTRKDRENGRLRKSHATRFMFHMHQKCPSNRFVNMKLIYNFHQIRQWPVVLLSQKYTPTSVKNMMLNASRFIAHVKVFHAETSGLINAQFDRILLQFKKLQKDNSTGELKPINRQSNMIRRRPQVNLFKLLQGYLAGYLGILTGHRPVALTNLQKDKVLQAEVDDNNRALVWVDHHKTDRTFGNAYMALLPHEVDWLIGLIEVSTAHFGGEQCPFVFQFEGKRLYKLNSELKAAWHHSRMQGQISFGLIRTAIANQAKKHLPAEERKLVCEAMCHDVSTADRFYTSVPEIGDVSFRGTSGNSYLLTGSQSTGH
ncbi:hypothetical protein MHYP_G00320540 [Metynnis hypsauchen]